MSFEVAVRGEAIGEWRAKCTMNVHSEWMSIASCGQSGNSFIHLFNILYELQVLWVYTDKGTQALESVQKFACKVCLKRWDMDYESVGTHFFITTSQVFKTDYIQCTISLTALYISLPATLYKIISRIPVVIFLNTNN